MEWHDQEAGSLFAGLDMTTTEAFMGVRDSLPGMRMTLMRSHACPSGGRDAARETYRLDVGDRVFYIKRGYGDYLDSLRAEVKALEIIPRFGLKPAKLAAACLDDGSGCFILLEDLAGFHSIKETLKGSVPRQLRAKFFAEMEVYFERISKAIQSSRNENYIYPDWLAKHLYITESSDEIALIDLERFRHASESPWYFSFPVTSFFTWRKIMMKFRESLSRENDCLSQGQLKKFFS